MPTARWQTDQNLTPFARLLQEWMWSQRPPLNASRLAELTGLRAPTIWKWFREDVTPDRETLGVLAAKTGIPLITLFEAAGYLDEADIMTYLRSLPEDQRKRVAVQLLGQDGADAECAVLK